MLFLPLVLMGRNRKYTNQVAEGRVLPTLKETGQMLLTFFLAVFGWIIFRAESIGQAWDYICGIFNKSLFSAPWLINRETYGVIGISLLVMLIVEWVNRSKQHGFELSARWPTALRYALYVVLAVVIIRFSGTPSAFIYFAF